MRNWLNYNGVDLRDFNVYISGSGTYNAPERDVKIISIPGRNGDLTLDNGRYKNITLKYPAFIVEHFNENIEALRDFLLSNIGYKRLEDTYHPEEYRKAKVTGTFTAKPLDELNAANFELTFDCMPQRFLKSGDESNYFRGEVGSTTYGTIYNPTKQNALPLLHVYPNGCSKVSISIYDSSAQHVSRIQIKDIGSGVADLVVDSEMQEVYRGDTLASYNDHIVLDYGVFPYINPDSNTVQITSEGTSIVASDPGVDIYPRWWRL